MEQTKSTHPPALFCSRKGHQEPLSTVWGDGLSEKCWSYKHEDLSSNPLQPCQQLGTKVCTCWPGTGEAKTEGSSGLAGLSLAEWQTGFNERHTLSVSKNEENLRKMPIHMCTYTQKCIHTCTALPPRTQYELSSWHCRWLTLSWPMNLPKSAKDTNKEEFAGFSGWDLLRADDWVPLPSAQLPGLKWLKSS